MFAKLFASAALLLALGMCSVGSAQHHGCGPCDDCGGPKTCVPKTETKKVAKPYYDCQCVQFCLPPKCQLGGHRHGCDDGGQCAECCAPRTKKVLIKKIKIEEQCETTCELQDAPCAECQPCRQPLFHRAGHCCEAAPCCDAPVFSTAPAAQGGEPIAPPKNMP